MDGDHNVYFLADRPLCEKLQLFLDGELNPVEAENYRIHLSRCEACAARLADILQLELLADLSRDRLLPEKGEPQARSVPRPGDPSKTPRSG